MRCFAGIELSELAIAAIAHTFRLPRPNEAGLSWVQPGALHITIWFFGDVEESALARLHLAMAQPLSLLPAFSLKLADIGQFPPRGQPRVLWVGVDDRANGCAACIAAVAGPLQGLGYSLDTRPYNPHITVARSRDEHGSRVLLRARKDTAVIAPVEWHVREVVIFRSDLHPTGSRYTSIARIPLAGCGSN